MHHLAGEDVAYLHEQLQRLDREIGGQVLDEETRVAYQTALAACESAQRTLEQISNAEEVSKVTEILTAGLYALACAQAGLASNWCQSSGSCVSSTRCTVFRSPRCCGPEPVTAGGCPRA